MVISQKIFQALIHTILHLEFEIVAPSTYFHKSVQVKC